MKKRFIIAYMIIWAFTGLQAQTSLNIAPMASKVTASYTASWNSLLSIKNGTVGYGLVGGGTPQLGNSETWGSWSSTRPATQWLQYDWSQAYDINKVTVYFWANNAALSGAGNDVAIPAGWTVQYWDATSLAWVEVILAQGQSYPLNISDPNTIQFNTVNTTKLRLNMNAQSNGSTYAALGVTEWQAYAVIAEPSILVSKSNINLSDQRGKSTATFNVKGVNIPADGISLSVSSTLTGIQLSATSISQANAQSEKGYDVTVTFTPESGNTAIGTINLSASEATQSVALVTSKDNECFTENPYNLIYDPRFLTMDRLSTWGTPPTLISISNGEDVKCGASCLKFTGTSGIESRNNIYLTASTYKTSGWIKTNGTFETGIYGSGGMFSSTENSVVEQGANYIYFLLPDTKGEWQYYEFTFTVKNPILGGIWVNNGHNETATLAYLDNWQIYDALTPTGSGTSGSTSSMDYPIQPVSFVDVKLNDIFWSPRIKRNQDVTIPIALEQCYSTGRVDNFKKAGGLMPGYFSTQYTFDDTDIYKILEGMSYSVQSYPNPSIEAQMDTLIYYIGKAQEPDGYLYTARTAGQPGNLHSWVGPNRWEWDPNLSHELYNCGHLYEAAVAHFKATGKRALLDIAIKNADLLVKDFLVGGLTYEPGHQIVEMGLVKMYRVTGKKEYLDLAKYFLDLRGTKGVARSEYSQSNIPVVKQTEAVGHAVRAVYMYSGMADVAALTNDKSYLHAIDTIWQNTIYRKYYITGGIGAKHNGEAFDKNYVLPNQESYCETCAAIGHVYWNHRLFLMHGDAKYYDVIERNLYNGVISGINLAGNRFFYPNPLQSDGIYLFNQGTNTRQAWFGCACCPSNLCRFTASVPGYVYAQKGDSIYVNLFVQGNSSIKIGDNTVHLSQETKYPWEGDVAITVNPETTEKFNLLIRIPGWARNQPVPGDLYTYLNSANRNIALKVNGSSVTYTVNEKGYIVLPNTWKSGDKIEFSLPMDVHRTVANINVAEDKGKVSLERGPIVYALEWPDNESNILNSVIEDNDSIMASFDPDLLTGIVSLKISGKAAIANSKNNTITLQDKQLTAIPYYAWDNRGIGEMAVWIARTKAYAKPKPVTDTVTCNVVVKPDYGINNTNYPYTIVQIDKQLVYSALGLSQADIQSKFGTTVIYAAANPTGTLNTTSTAGSPGHWFDNYGKVTKHAVNSYLYSEMDLANMAFKIGLYPGLGKEGDRYTIMQALTYTPDSTSARIIFKFNVTISNSTGIETDNNNDLQIYTSGKQLIVNNLSGKAHIDVYDSMSRRFIHCPVQTTTYTAILPAGIYIVSVDGTKRKIIVN